MAKKTERVAPERGLTRKQLSRAEREALVRRRILLSAAAVLGLVVLVLAAGAVESQVLAPNRGVATVNGETITTREYQRRVNFDRWRLANARASMQAQLAQVPADDPSAGFLNQIIQQQLQQLDSQYNFIGSQALDDLITERLVRQKAAEVGIEVTDEEVSAEVERQIGAQIGAVRPEDATATATADAQATVTAQSWTPTPEPTPTATLTATSEITQTATPFPPTETPAPTPTPNYLTDEKYQEQLKTYLDAMREATGYTEADFRGVVHASLVQDKLRDYFADQVPTEEEQVQVQQLLLATEEEANLVRQELEAGKSFEDVAKEIAARTGGELPRFGPGEMQPEFEEAAKALPVGEYSDPVQTQFGWHVIEVLSRTGDIEGEDWSIAARHILVETEEEAEEIKEQLEEGADFGTLAVERSTDPSGQPDETDLGWLTRGSTATDAAVIERAFELEAGAVSEPIETESGQWAVIQVVAGPEERPLDEALLEQKRTQAFEDWLSEAKAAEGVNRDGWDTTKIPPDPFMTGA